MQLRRVCGVAARFLRAYSEFSCLGRVLRVFTENDDGLWLHPSRDAAEAAWAEQTGQTPQEFGRVFDAVDSVHAYS